MRPAIHTPRHTIQLASTARHRSCSAGSVILVCTTLSTNALTGSALKMPERTTITASSTLPSRLPTQVQPQLATRSRTEVLRVSTPRVSTRLLPVNNSDPAKMTMVSAPPKQTPMTGFTSAGKSFDSAPPMVKISTIAAPTYMPASIDRTRWAGSESRCAAIFAAACSPIVSIASAYIVVVPGGGNDRSRQRDALPLPHLCNACTTADAATPRRGKRPGL